MSKQFPKRQRVPFITEHSVHFCPNEVHFCLTLPSFVIDELVDRFIMSLLRYMLLYHYYSS